VSELVFMFPGQSSKYPEMIEKVTAAHPESRAVVARASEILGRDLAAHYRADNGALFASNRDVQIGVFLANHLHLLMLDAAGVRAPWSLGLSLGEYNHLVHVGALSFEDALPLVDARGRLYDEHAGGVMISVFPVEAAVVERAIAALGVGDRVAVGLYNSPRQQVLSGEQAAVERVVAALEAEDFIEAAVIEPRIPMHAPVFAPVAAGLAHVLARTRLVAPRGAYVPNVRGEVLEGASADDVRACLTAHVHRPVLWQKSIDAVAARLPGACFVEVGPRAVLYNLFGRGWTPGRRARTDATEGWSNHFASLVAELHAA
jgi:[acyl-carrier-protein] S-malonyltransferase